MDPTKLELAARAELTGFLHALNDRDGTKKPHVERAIAAVSADEFGEAIIDRSQPHARSIGFGAVTVIAYDLTGDQGRREFVTVPREDTVLLGTQGGDFRYGVVQKSVYNDIGRVILGWLGT